MHIHIPIRKGYREGELENSQLKLSDVLKWIKIKINCNNNVPTVGTHNEIFHGF